MRGKVCETCLCDSCLNNAEDYADGCCRDCEQCELEDFSWRKNQCTHYLNDSDINNVL